MNLLDARRRAPRISLDGLCGVVSDDDGLCHASMSDLSSIGLCIERPFDARTARPVVQLEIELPGVDEIVWASAAVTYARVTRMRGRGRDGQARFWCRTGLRIASASQRERRLLRDYVVERLIQVRRASDRRSAGRA
jgi:hypothetical protein